MAVTKHRPADPLPEGYIHVYHPACGHEILVLTMQLAHLTKTKPPRLLVEGICPVCEVYVLLEHRGDEGDIQRVQVCPQKGT